MRQERRRRRQLAGMRLDNDRVVEAVRAAVGDREGCRLRPRRVRTDVEEVLGQRRNPVEVGERLLNLGCRSFDFRRRDDERDAQRCIGVVGQLIPERLEWLLARQEVRPRLVVAVKELADG
jgi:hypothetical protein